MSGMTHGDRNDTAPARNASGQLTGGSAGGIPLPQRVCASPARRRPPIPACAAAPASDHLPEKRGGPARERIEEHHDKRGGLEGQESGHSRGADASESPLRVRREKGGGV